MVQDLGHAAVHPYSTITVPRPPLHIRNTCQSQTLLYTFKVIKILVVAAL
jgi:hypothetical protein